MRLGSFFVLGFLSALIGVVGGCEPIDGNTDPSGCSEENQSDVCDFPRLQGLCNATLVVGQTYSPRVVVVGATGLEGVGVTRIQSLSPRVLTVALATDTPNPNGDDGADVSRIVLSPTASGRAEFFVSVDKFGSRLFHYPVRVVNDESEVPEADDCTQIFISDEEAALSQE